MLPVLYPTRASSSSLPGGGSEWDVEAEIAKELLELDQHDKLGQDASTLHLLPRDLSEADPAPAPVAALWAAFTARDHIADKLAATIQELHSLPSQANPDTKVLETAITEQVHAALAALRECTGVPIGAAGAEHSPKGPTTALSTEDTCCCCPSPAHQHGTGVQQPPAAQQQAEQHLKPASTGRSKHHAASASPVHAPELAATTATPAHLPVKPRASHDQQLIPALPAGEDVARTSATPATAAVATAASVPAVPVVYPTPPHTPNTQDKRQYTAPAPTADNILSAQQPAKGGQGCLTLEASSDQPQEASGPVCSMQHTETDTVTESVVAAAAAAAAIAAEQAAAEAAQRQRLREQRQLQQVLEQQAAAAAARQAAQATARQQLQQQAAAAARSYMAAWRIAGAWQEYRRSPARALRLAAATTLQCAIRAASALQLLRQLYARQQLLSGLQAAERSGDSNALNMAAAAAAEAGLKADAQQALQRYQAACSAAAQELQQAADTGSHAAFTAAAANASKYAQLTEACSSCARRFQARQQAAVRALHAAMAALPLQQVQCTVDVALELGVCRKELKAGLEAARARDEAAVTRLSNEIKALKTTHGIVLARSHSMGVSSAVGCEPAVASSATDAQAGMHMRSPRMAAFELSAFLDAAAACRQYGRHAEAAAAEAALQACRETAAVQLAEHAERAPAAASVEQLVTWCAQLGGLQHESLAAAQRLQQRQQGLADQLLALIKAPEMPVLALQRMLQQAHVLSVPAGALAAAASVLQQWRAAAEQQCWAAARGSTLQQFLNAVAVAAEQGVAAPHLQLCRQVMGERQKEAAESLAASTAEVCSGLHAQLATAEVAEVQQLVLLLQQLYQDAAVAVKPRARSVLQALELPSDDVHTVPTSLHRLHEQAVACIRLGLSGNVKAAAGAVAQSLLAVQAEGSMVLASCKQRLDDTCSAAVMDAASPADEPPPQPLYLWEDGQGMEQDSVWAGGDYSQPLQHLQTSDNSGGAAEQPSPAGMPHASLRQHVGSTWVLDLQARWAANLCDALADTGTEPAQATVLQGLQGTDHKPTELLQLQQKGQRPSEGTVEQGHPLQQQANNWLQRLLAANAVGPLDHLTQLDLSLEQLPGLHGLDALCPLLVTVAANMNGLESLRGLQGCSGLAQLSAQDNQLQALPNISCHPQLTALLLDSNQLTSLAVEANGGCTTALQVHSQLHTLSLANNKLASLAGTPVQVLPSSRQPSTGGGPAPGSSNDWQTGTVARSSAANGGPTVLRVQMLSRWLPGLQVLRLAGNQLRDLCSLQGCSCLRVLDVSRNQLTSLQGLAGCHVLQQLDASDNRLCTFPAGLHLPILQRLMLSCNGFVAWPDLPPLPHLVQLSLADNQLRKLAVLHELLQLRTLDLSFNALTDLEACIAALQTAPQLKQLQIHDNNFHVPMQPPDGTVWAWLASGAAGRAAVAGVEVEAWYRQQLAAGLPWLLQLDGDDIQPAERLPRHARQLQAAGSTSSSDDMQHQQQLSCQMATGRLVTSSSPLSLLLLQQLKVGCVGLWGPAVQQELAAATTAATAPGSSPGGAAAAAVCCTSNARFSPGAVTCSHLVGLQAAATWLTCCNNLASVSPVAWLLQLKSHQPQQPQGHASGRAASSGSGPSCQGASSWQGDRIATVFPLPCVHLQQALLQPGFNIWSCRCSCFDSVCSGDSKAVTCNCPAWLQQAEAAWCYSTRAWLVQGQAAQQAAAQRSGCSTLLLPPGMSTEHTSSFQAAASKVAIPGTAAVALAKCHLVQLQQACCKQQQQVLLRHPSSCMTLVSEVAAAAVLLQSSWRARAARVKFRQQQQEAMVEAALTLQCLWRGYCCRQAAAQQKQLKAHACAAAASAAAVTIQAAVRGHKVRQRLKAALTAARSNSISGLSSGAAILSQQQPTSGLADSSTSTAREPMGTSTLTASGGEDGWDFDGVPEGFVCIAEDLLDDLLLPGFTPDNVQPDVHLQQLQEQLRLSAGRASALLLQAGTEACEMSQVPDQDTSKSCQDEEVVPSAATGAAAAGDAACVAPRGARLSSTASHMEARISALMAEWGFSDRATAEAYYRRQRHTLKAVAKHKLEKQLMDPAVRLKRLQAQLGSHSSAAALPPPATAAVGTSNANCDPYNTTAEKCTGKHSSSSSSPTVVSTAAAGLRRLAQAAAAPSTSTAMQRSMHGIPRGSAAAESGSSSFKVQGASNIMQEALQAACEAAIIMACTSEQQQQHRVLPLLTTSSLTPTMTHRDTRGWSRPVANPGNVSLPKI